MAKNVNEMWQAVKRDLELAQKKKERAKQLAVKQFTKEISSVVKSEIPCEEKISKIKDLLSLYQEILKA